MPLNMVFPVPSSVKNGTSPFHSVMMNRIFTAKNMVGVALIFVQIICML